jgi:hypothetical protein
MGMLAVSAYAVVEVVERSENIEETNRNWWRQNEITVVMTLISYSFPILFEVLGIIESHHPRKQLRLQLGRYVYFLSINHAIRNRYYYNAFNIHYKNLFNLSNYYTTKYYYLVITAK